MLNDCAVGPYGIHVAKEDIKIEDSVPLFLFLFTDIMLNEVLPYAPILGKKLNPWLLLFVCAATGHHESQQ